MFKLKKPHDRWKENFKTVKTWPSGTFLLYSFRSYDPTKATFSVVVVEHQVSRGCHLRCSYLGEKTCKYQKRYDRWKENFKPVKTWPCATRLFFSFRSYALTKATLLLVVLGYSVSSYTHVNYLTPGIKLGSLTFWKWIGIPLWVEKPMATEMKYFPRRIFN